MSGDMCEMCLCMEDDENPVVLDGEIFMCMECVKDKERQYGKYSKKVYPRGSGRAGSAG